MVRCARVCCMTFIIVEQAHVNSPMEDLSHYKSVSILIKRCSEKCCVVLESVSDKHIFLPPEAEMLPAHLALTT